MSREFKDEVVSYLDSASMGLEGEGEGEGTGKLFHDPASPSNGGARRKGQPRAGRYEERSPSLLDRLHIIMYDSSLEDPF